MLTETDTAALDDAAEELTEEEREEEARCAAIVAELAESRVEHGWAQRAVCASRAYTYNMYPEPGDHRGLAIALGACARCPVRLSCLAETLDAEGDTPERTRAGVTGGTTPRERWIIAGRPKRSAPGGRGGKTPAPCGTAAALERHRRAGEECETCTAWRVAESERIAARAREAQEEAVKDCGTVAGYVKHREGRTAVCPRCKLAAQLGQVTWSEKLKRLVPKKPRKSR